MLKIIVAVCFAAVCALFTYVLLEKKLADKMPLLNSLGLNKERESKNISKIEMILLVIIVAIIAYCSVLRLLIQVEDILNIVRMMIIYIPVLCAGSVDYREKRIPNIFPLLLFISGCAFLVLDFIFYRDAFQSYLVSCGIACIGPLILLTIVGFITGKGIGAGDIKLISALGLVAGIYALCGTLIFATVICALVAAFLLITKKKTLKSSLPYGPFIAVGYMITVIVNFY